MTVIAISNISRESTSITNSMNLVRTDGCYVFTVIIIYDVDITSINTPRSTIVSIIYLVISISINIRSKTSK